MIAERLAAPRPEPAASRAAVRENHRERTRNRRDGSTIEAQQHLASASPSFSRLGLGLAALGRPTYLNLGHGDDLAGRRGAAARERNAHAVLDAAYQVGVRHVDAARSYGDAEQMLATWLEKRRVRPGEIVVGSKWNPRRRVDMETLVAALRRQLEVSRGFLGDHLSLYQIHSLRPESGALEDRAVLEELEHLRAAGLAIGFSVRGTGQAETIERALASFRFDTVQATWNLLERSAEPALARAHDAGTGVIVKEALANGRLTSRGDVALLKDVARERGVTPDALALAAALAQPWADIVLSGAATVETFRSNARALDVEYDEPLAVRLAPVVEESEAYWAARERLAAHTPFSRA